MFLKNIYTRGYRNLAEQSLELYPGINLLYGKNAAGKTNTLECAYFFASGRSFRTRHEAQLIRRGEESASAKITISRTSLPEHMSVTWRSDAQKGLIKRMYYQGMEVSKASEFLGIFRAVLFTPDNLALIKGVPEERRRFMDIAMSQLQPRYVYFLNEYLRILSQKNSYLKKAAYIQNPDFDYLDVLNEQLAKAAAVLIKQRSGFVSRLRSFSSEFYNKLSGSKEELNVKYVSCTKRDFSDSEYTEKKMFDIYRADRDSEIKNGRTMHGPHKDDMLIYISGISKDDDGLPHSVFSEHENEEDISQFAARTFASQGQQRSAVLALKFAEGEVCRELTGEYPVFLLDDLLGELDLQRRTYITSIIRDKQAIISCCDKTALPDMNNVSSVKVEDGIYYPDTDS